MASKSAITSRGPTLVFSRRDSPLDTTGQALNAKEPFGVGLIVRTAAFHGSDAFVVQIVGARAARDNNVPFVKVQFHFPRYRLLCLANEGEQCVELRGVPKAVIDAFGNNRGELVTKMHEI